MVTVPSQQKPIITTVPAPSAAPTKTALIPPPTTGMPAPAPAPDNSVLVKNVLMPHLIASGVGTLGAVAGIVYNVKTGGGFWRGVGFFLLGGIVFGLPAHVIANVYVAKQIVKK